MHCVLCEQPIYIYPDDVMRVPVIDPFDSPYADELMSLMGKDIHAACWIKHTLWPEVACLAIKQHMADFPKDKMLLKGKFAAVWIRHLKENYPSAGVGYCFLPRSIYVFDNLFGEDCTGGYIGSNAEDILDMLDAIQQVNLPLEREYLHDSSLRRNVVVHISPSQVNGRFLLQVMHGARIRVKAFIQLEDIVLMQHYSQLCNTHHMEP